MAFQQTTLATLRGRVRERLLSTFWSDSELNAYINEALRVWNICTGYNRNYTTSQSYAANTFGYAVAAPQMFVLRVERTDNTHLDPITLKDLGNMDLNWASRTSSSPTHWMQVGTNKFFLYPQPTGTQFYNIYTLDIFTLPSGDSDFIQLGEEDIQYIVDYAVFVARLKEGGKEASEAVPLLQGFLRQAAKYNAKILDTSLYKRFLGATTREQTRRTKLEHETVR